MTACAGLAFPGKILYDFRKNSVSRNVRNRDYSVEVRLDCFARRIRNYGQR